MKSVLTWLPYQCLQVRRCKGGHPQIVSAATYADGFRDPRHRKYFASDKPYSTHAPAETLGWGVAGCFQGRSRSLPQNRNAQARHVVPRSSGYLEVRYGGALTTAADRKTRRSYSEKRHWDGELDFKDHVPLDLRLILLGSEEMQL